MLIFLDESGDLGWSFDKPRLRGGSSRFITIAGIAIEESQMKFLARYVHQLYLKHNFEPHVEIKGSKFLNGQATSIVNDLRGLAGEVPSLQIISITSDKRKVFQSLHRDKNVFYNYMLHVLLTDFFDTYRDLDLVLDDRTIRHGSRNSLEDCLKAKCWGELGLNTSISCRYENSNRNPGIWMADWLANFIWRHYENSMHDAYHECCAQGDRYHEKTLFM